MAQWVGHVLCMQPTEVRFPASHRIPRAPLGMTPECHGVWPQNNSKRTNVQRRQHCSSKEGHQGHFRPRSLPGPWRWFQALRKGQSSVSWLPRYNLSPLGELPQRSVAVTGTTQRNEEKPNSRPQKEPISSSTELHHRLWVTAVIQRTPSVMAT